MTSSFTLLLRRLGAALHLIVLVYVVSVAAAAETEILYADGQLTKVGTLATLAFAMHFAGVLGFALYRPTTISRASLLFIELATFAGSCILFSADLALVAGITFAAAIALALRNLEKSTSLQPGRTPD
jgi:hypothetical protein